jgi:Fe-S-cluster containining protein
MLECTAFDTKHLRCGVYGTRPDHCRIYDCRVEGEDVNDWRARPHCDLERHRRIEAMRARQERSA